MSIDSGYPFLKYFLNFIVFSYGHFCYLYYNLCYKDFFFILNIFCCFLTFSRKESIMKKRNLLKRKNCHRHWRSYRDRVRHYKRTSGCGCECYYSWTSRRKIKRSCQKARGTLFLLRIRHHRYRTL